MTEASALECRLVPYAEQAAYLDAGWTLKPLSGPHAKWRVLAVREVPDDGRR